MCAAGVCGRSQCGMAILKNGTTPLLPDWRNEPRFFFSFFFLLQTRAAESANYKKQKRVGWVKCMKILKMVHIGGLHGAFKGRDETIGGGGVANSYVVSTGFNLNATSWIPVVLPSKQLAYCCKPQICRHSPGNRCCCSLRSFFLLVTASLWV